MRIIVILLAFLAINACQHNDTFSNRNQPLNQGWKFVKGNPEFANALDFIDSSWRNVDLPHDIGIEDLTLQDSTRIGPFSKEMEMGVDVGFLKGGIAWYRKHIIVHHEQAGKQFILHFDGIQSKSEIFVNGIKAHENVYGYTPFHVNITSLLKDPGKDNVIAVRVENPEINSRWYAGFGINREVHLSMVDPVHVANWGVFVTTPKVSKDHATVGMDITLNSTRLTPCNPKIEVEIFDPAGAMVISGQKTITIQTNDVSQLALDLQVIDPVMWTIESPQLYNARISVWINNKIIDVYDQLFGIRTIEFSVEEGFKLNGKGILLKGACMHHDNGLLGAAAFRDAEYRRVNIMKENGFNTIRTSHNPPSKHFLDACDVLGMLVIDEAFDMWELPKRKNDYHLYFRENWENDLEAMILRDRNHPSIIMWSYGNEVQERARPRGIEIAKLLVDKIKHLDVTRPTTQAICHFWDNPDQNWEDHTPAAFAMMDVAGYNYRWQNYQSDHQLYPDRIMYGSESFPKEAFENWNQVEQNAYVIGDFVWTGMDYLGESGIGHSVYKDTDEEEWLGLPGWPWYVSFCGDIDIIGNKKPQSLYRDVVWGESRLEILVHEPIPKNRYEHLTAWGWPREFNHWNWNEGDELSVNVYSSFPQIRLELNGEIIDEREIDLEKGITATFKVPYQAGKLNVIAKNREGQTISKTLKTTKSFSQINLKADTLHVNSDRNELIYIAVQALDEDGNLVPTSSEQITFELDGEGELLAAGSANPLITGSFQDRIFNLFEGQGLIILRSTGVPGDIVIRAHAKGLDNQEVVIKVR